MSEEVKIHPTASVEEGAELGEGTMVWHYAQIRKGAKLGKNCRVGKSAYIGENVELGDGCKVQNFGTLYKGAHVGNNVFIGPHAVFTNDMYPRAEGDGFELVETFVEDGASIGTNATIVCGITIGRYAMIGAGAVVTKDVPPHALILGNPGRVVGYVCHCGRRLSNKGGDRWICDHCGKGLTIEEGHE